MKKVVISILIIISMLFLIYPTQFVYADSKAQGEDQVDQEQKKEEEKKIEENRKKKQEKEDDTKNDKTVDTSNWVQRAFKDATSFFKEKSVDEDGLWGTLLGVFKDIIKAVNMVLLILLAGLSAISLSIIGVRYIVGGTSVVQQNIARKSLRRALTGMAYGFGAYIIWTISMSIVSMILSALAN